MCEIKIGESLAVNSNGLHLTTEKSVECFRVFPEYQTQDVQTKRNMLEKLKEWIKSEEARQLLVCIGKITGKAGKI